MLYCNLVLHVVLPLSDRWKLHGEASRHRNNIRAKFQSLMMQTTENQERTFFFLWPLPPMGGVAIFAFGISK